MGLKKANIGPNRVKLGQTRAQMGQNDRNRTKIWLKKAKNKD